MGYRLIATVLLLAILGGVALVLSQGGSEDQPGIGAGGTPAGSTPSADDNALKNLKIP